ncbi:MAG: NERD domain-containing protein [Caldilineaceae bacterium]|nr:NERD domain-containing protein [Caldilineaceae bacterium]
MIPAQIYMGNPSPGEKEIFRRLADDPHTDEWIVLHSLDIADHIERMAGEADFVVIVPQKGVLCLEIKAALSIRREEGLWYYGSKTTPDKRGPFKQASQAMHSIRQRLLKKSRNLASIPIWSAVVFPYVRFDIRSGEWHQWQVIDGAGLRRKPISLLIVQVLEEARKLLEEKSAPWFDKSGNEPTLSQCEEIAKILRPDFEIFEPPRKKLERLDQEAKQYTEEQFVALDAMAANPRVVFSGPAGTGKTVLAIEAARRSRAAGNRVLFLCYNRLLGQHLDAETAAIQPEVTVRTLHKHMLEVTGANLHGKIRSSRFWHETLPQMAIDSLLEDETERFLYDEIIVDETQDLLRNDYLDFIDLSLKGGLNAGKWKFFGDFEKQAIYESNAEISIGEAISTRFGNPPQYALRVNCRNVPRIATLVHLLGDLNPEYSRILRPDDGIEPEIIYYADERDQQRRLLETIAKLKREGFAYSDIAVLSPKAPHKAITSTVNSSSGVIFASLEHARKNQIRCGSIHAFKGMESSAVIVTDVETISGEQAISLFYTAMTRALHRLFILAHDNVRCDVLERILQS